MIYIYIYVYIYIYIYIYIHNTYICFRYFLMLHRFGRGDDEVGNPYRAQIFQFELFEVNFLNSSFSSLSNPVVEIR